MSSKRSCAVNRVVEPDTYPAQFTGIRDFPNNSFRMIPKDKNSFLISTSSSEPNINNDIQCHTSFNHSSEYTLKIIQEITQKETGIGFIFQHYAL